MLDTSNPDVLSYVRSTGSGPAVVVAMNFTAAPKIITLNLAGSGVTGTKVKTLAASDPSLLVHLDPRQHHAAAVRKLDSKRTVALFAAGPAEPSPGQFPSSFCMDNRRP